MMMARSLALSVCLLLLTLSAQASQKGVRVYRIPKAPVIQEATLPTWVVPSHWQSTAPQALQEAAWIISGSDANLSITVVSLGKNAGTLQDNLARWEGQIQADRQHTDLSTFRFSDKTGHFAMLEGAFESIFVGILTLGDKTWFVKLKGNKALARQHLSSFQQFLESIHLTAPSGSHGTP